MWQTIVPSARQVRLILIGSALLITLTMGIRQSFGLFLTPVTQDLKLTAADFTLALVMQNVAWGLSQALIGALADRFGLRITMMAGAAIYIAGLVLMAAAQGQLALIVAGSLFGIALSCTATTLPMTACVRAVSEKRRSMVLGIIVGSSLGAWGGGLIFDLSGTYDRAWQIGTLVGLTAGVVQILAGGPTRRRDPMAVPALANT